MSRKGVPAFLAITFGITWLVEGILILGTGWRVDNLSVPLYGQLTIAAVMWVPGLAAFLTVRFITRQGVKSLNLRFGSWKPYLWTALLIPLAFVLTYALTWLLGLAQPDWQLAGFYAQVAAMGADMSTAPAPGLLLPALFIGTVITTPLINGLFGLGEEIGWRGYLLPSLMPLGKWKAYLLLGVIWGLWHAPLVLAGFNYGEYRWLGVLGMCGLTTAIGIPMNELTLRHRSTLLAGWMHGAFNSQGYGIWRMLFMGYNPLLGGLTGVVGMVVFAALGLAVMAFGRKGEQTGQLV